jgi:phytanoyl-CoA hydroxylase
VSSSPEETLVTEALGALQQPGYYAIRSVLAPATLAAAREHLMGMRHPPESERARYAQWPFHGFVGDKALHELQEAELEGMTRIMRPHLFDPVTRALLLAPELWRWVEALLGEGALLAHSIFVPKPPRARGCAFHSDHHYFRAEPQPCLGAYVALDDADDENGAFCVVPGTQGLDHRPARSADLTRSGVEDEFAIPDGAEPRAIPVAAGDVILFDSSLLHGAMPNASADRWRRALISHYVARSCRCISRDCQPLFDCSGAPRALPEPA